MIESTDYLLNNMDRLESRFGEIADKEAFMNNIFDFMNVVREIESSNDNSQVNPDSGAAGLYQ